MVIMSKMLTRLSSSVSGGQASSSGLSEHELHPLVGRPDSGETYLGDHDGSLSLAGFTVSWVTALPSDRMA